MPAMGLEPTVSMLIFRVVEAFSEVCGTENGTLIQVKPLVPGRLPDDPVRCEPILALEGDRVRLRRRPEIPVRVDAEDRLPDLYGLPGIPPLDLRDMGMVLGYGCGTPSMTRGSGAPEEAYRLGKSL